MGVCLQAAVEQGCEGKEGGGVLQSQRIWCWLEPVFMQKEQTKVNGQMSENERWTLSMVVSKGCAVKAFAAQAGFVLSYKSYNSIHWHMCWA